MVHLLDQMDFYDHYTKPLSVTQKGISERTGLKQNTISYALNGLKGSDLVEEKTSRVRDKKQRMKTYFLTEEGVKRAKEVRKKMEESPVDIEMYGEERTVKAKNVNDYIPSDMDLLDIILEGEDGGLEFKVGDGSSVIRASELPAESSPEDIDTSPLEGWYADGKEIGVLKGSYPWLLSAFTRRFEEDTNIFYFKVRSYKRSIHLWDSLANFLDEIGRVNLSSYIEFEEGLEERKALENLKKDLEYTSALIIFDRLEEDPKMKELILDITENISGYRHVRTLLCSKEEEIERSMENASEIVVQENDTDGGESDRGDLEELLTLQLGYELSLALSYLSIFREPVKKDELLRIDRIDKEALDEIVESPLVIECRDDRITVPKAVRKKKKESMSSDTKKNIHYLAAKYYEEKEGTESRDELERLYHLVHSEERKKVLSMLKDEALEIVSEGYAEPFLDIIYSYEDREDHPRFIYHKAEAQRVTRDFEDSKESYQQLLETSEEIRWEFKAKVGLGKVEEKLGRFDKAIDHMNEAERVAKNESGLDVSVERDLLGRVYVRRGELWNKLGDHEKARRDLKNAIEILVDEEDHHLLTSSYLILARMERSLGEIEDAIEPFKMGLKAWSELEDSTDVGERRSGTLYRVLKELGDADIRFRKGYSSESVGPVQEEYEDLRASALLSLAGCHMEDGSYEKAIKTAEDAKVSLLEEDKMEMAFVEALLGRAYLETGGYMKAQDHLSKAISLYNELNQPYKLGLTYFSMAKVKEKSGDTEAVEKYYRKAVLSLSRSGAEQDAEKVKREIESIPISL